MKILQTIGKAGRAFKLWLRRFLSKALMVKLKTRKGKKVLVPLKYCTHLILFPLVLIYSEIILRLLNGTGVFQNLIYPILFAIGLGMLLNIPTTMFKKKINRIITIVLLALIAVVYITECLTHNSYQTYMTFSSLLTGAGGVMTGFGGDFLRAIFSGALAFILFLLPGALYLIFGKKKMQSYRYKPYFLLPLLIVCVVFFGITSLAASTGKMSSLYKDQFDFDTSTVVFGLPSSLRLSLVRGDNDTAEFAVQTSAEVAPVNDDIAAGDVVEDGQADVETGETTSNRRQPPAGGYPLNQMDIDLEAVISRSNDKNVTNITKYVQSLQATSQNAYTGLFKGKNLILICAEAFSDAVISEELTPTLYRMVHNGFYFSNYYQPTWGGSTSTGEYSMLTGLVPTNGVDTMQDIIGHNLYFTMGNQLQREGYFNAAFHNGTYDYYDRHKTHQYLGYGIWLAQNNGLEDMCGAYPTDEVMLAKTLEYYKDQQPFSTYYMTVCGHAPYKTSKKYVKNNGEYLLSHVTRSYENTTMCYLAYQYELEKAMTTLVRMLEEYGMADNTVVVLTSDHYPYGLAKSGTWGNTEDYIADLYGDPNYAENPWGRDHNTLIIWSGCLEHEDQDMACEISTPTYSLDILPTLSNLFGLEFDSRLMVGRDVFSDAEPMVVYSNGTIITEKGGYNGQTKNFVSFDGTPVDEDYIKRICDIAANKVKFSRFVKSTDYYAVLFGKDEYTDANIRGTLPAVGK